MVKNTTLCSAYDIPCNFRCCFLQFNYIYLLSTYNIWRTYCVLCSISVVQSSQHVATYWISCNSVLFLFYPYAVYILSNRNDATIFIFLLLFSSFTEFLSYILIIGTNTSNKATLITINFRFFFCFSRLENFLHMRKYRKYLILFVLNSNQNLKGNFEDIEIDRTAASKQ